MPNAADQTARTSAEQEGIMPNAAPATDTEIEAVKAALAQARSKGTEWSLDCDWGSFSDEEREIGSADFVEDAALIVSAVNTLPGILTRLEAAERERDESRQFHAHATIQWEAERGKTEAAEARIRELEDGLREADPAALVVEFREAVASAEKVLGHAWISVRPEKLRALLDAVEADRTAAARDVLAERRRQVQVEDWTPEYDDTHVDGQLGTAAACYAYMAAASEPEMERVMREGAPYRWPWAASWWKPTTRRRNLVKAGAMILAEIERLDRLSAPPRKEPSDEL